MLENLPILYSQHSKTFENQPSDDLSENQYKIPEPSKDCQKLRDKIMKQAGAELCQAQDRVEFSLAEFSFV